jgi:hypothetical protein
MKTSWILGYVVLMLSCSTLLRGSTNPPKRTAPSAGPPACMPCPRQEVVVSLIEDLEQCEARIVTVASSIVKVKQVPVEKTVVKIEKRRCADDGPHIQPVFSTKCMAGQLCLDDEAQRVQAKNMAAYEAWVQRVKDCEAK